MNYIPIICPVCDKKLTYIKRELRYNSDDEFHSLFCFSPAVQDEFARDSHALFNFNNNWEPHHLEVTINSYTINRDYRFYIFNSNDQTVFESKNMYNVNWSSQEDLTTLIKTLLTFQ